MQPSVPFALLGAVVLLAVAGWLALGATALARSRRPSGVLVALGAVVLAVTEVVTATVDAAASYGDRLLLARAAGLLLLAGGLYAGAVARRAPLAVPGVVVPLAGGTPPAVLAAAAGLAAAVASVRARRDGPGLLLTAALVGAAVAAGLAPVADQRTGALAVLLVRGGSALLLLGGLLVLARSSLLGKVVAAVLGAVLVMAVAAVGVVGTVVASAAVQEQNGLVEDAAAARLTLVSRNLEAVKATAPLADEACRRTPRCAASFFDVVAGPTAPTFAVRVPRTGAPVDFGGRAPLRPEEAVALAGSRLVELALAGGPERVGAEGTASVVRLLGATPGLALVAAVPGPRPTPQAEAPSVFLYGVRLGDDFVRSDLEDGGFGLSLLVGDQVVASNRSARDQAQVQRIARTAGLATGTGDRTVPADGDSPSVSFRTLRSIGDDPAGTIALSRSAQDSLAAQETSLRSLLLTAVLVTVVVAGLALVLGRRTVEPVRRLTAAARLVAAGDLSVTTGMTGRDEVGTLSRSFDAMTGSVSRLTGDLQATASRLATVLSSMSDGLLAVDDAGVVTSANPAALAMLGLPGPQVLGHPLDEVLDLRSGAADLDLRGSTPADRPGEVHRSDGSTVAVRVAVAPLDDGRGQVLVLRDTTREREVERMKTEFLSNVSHELRTPLTPIRGYAELLVAKPGLASEQVTTFATTIRDEALRMNRVVDLLVDVAAIEAGRVTTDPRPVSPGELVDDRLAAWRARVPGRARDLRRRVTAGLPPVQVDPVWVGKALDELLDNALKHTPDGTPVTLAASWSPDGDRVRVAVRDAGPGIAAADREAVFRSFEQVDGSATRRVGGLGLGLSFVRRLAEDAGFPMVVSSELGRGSEFALDLPLASASPPASPAARPTAPGRGRGR